MPQRRTQICHFTHYENLSSIMQHKGLLMVKSVHGGSVTHKDIAYSDVQDKRAATPVPVPPGGVLHDYVPFYFAPRSPMLYTIHRGNVHQYNEGQRPLVYLVSTAQHVMKAARPFVFTDGHGIIKITNFFNQESDLHHVDWDLMRERQWADTNADPDRKRRRQAEFLVHQFFPWTFIVGIGTYNSTIKEKVEYLISGQTYKPLVKIKRAWYF